MTNSHFSELDQKEVRNAETVAQGLLAEASRTGELAVAIARLLGGSVITLAWPLTQWDNLMHLEARSWATVLLGILAVGWSLFVLVQLRRRTPGAMLIYTSIAVDAIVFNAMLLMFVLWPSDIHQSIAEVHGTSFVYIGIVTAGIRLSSKAAYFGAVLNSLLLALLVAISTVMVGNLKYIGWAEWTTVAVGLTASTILSVNIAGRTAKLVRQAAEKTLISEKARSRLGAYVSDEVADVVMRESELRLGGQRQEVAILFSDLRGFTSYSESLEPEQIVEQLNDYMSVMVDTIGQHGGVVDKFMGDGIMAVFGAPVSNSDDADRAVECALAMMRAIELHNEGRVAKNLPKLTHGIGVHYGPVVAGNVGTASRAAYTVIGDSVNLASRLEQHSKLTECDVIVSMETVEICQREHALERIAEIQVKGREKPVTIYGG
ncbi:MAG: adenylate/guanylate cyclase domain-containing protein [Planctomycetota bacterium]